MARKLFQFLLVILISLGFLSYLGFTLILSNIEQNEHARQKRLLTDISTQIGLSFELLDKLLIQKQQRYRALHYLARSLLMSADHPDLSELQKIMEKKAGFPIDLYIIDADLTITDTTFVADRGLDFKQPQFLDAQMFLSKARESRQILVGQPNMEFVSKKFKIYTYSVLDDHRYLELGFIDPDINGYFQRLFRYLSEREDARITLFIEYWDQVLLPLTTIIVKTAEEKLVLMKQNQVNTEKNQRAFRHTRNSTVPYHTQTIDAQGQEISSYYLQVPGLSNVLIDELSVRYLAKITFNDQKTSVIRDRFQLFLFLSMLLSSTGVLILTFYIRHGFIRPINQILLAIKYKSPVTLTQIPSGSNEIRKIALTYNDTLEHLKQSILELEQQSSIDPLTGISNRRKFTHLFDLEVARASRNQMILALAMIDLDYFKDYNDRFGHQQGDWLLIELARLMKSRFMRPSDQLCRMGGDEFSVLLTDIDPSTIVSVFEHLKQKWICQYHENALKTDAADTWTVTLSIGIYVFDSSLKPTWKVAYQRADGCLYQAKENGRNQVVMEKDLPEQDILLQHS